MLPELRVKKLPKTFGITPCLRFVKLTLQGLQN